MSVANEAHAGGIVAAPVARPRRRSRTPKAAVLAAAARSTAMASSS